ncbi:MAG TPA: HD domain-containing protein [Flavisolibacter sp.]|nr:HD domain-containing protein [Flavisolibacter sp.]
MQNNTIKTNGSQQLTADFQVLKDKVVRLLTEQGKSALTYHTVEHTLDVLSNAERIALEEGVFSEKELLLLKVAALYHDTGFLFVYKGHEEKSCEILTKDLHQSEFTPKDIATMCSLIMATKIPQSPKTHLEQVICDADLDYLGRNDFEFISNNLRKEFFDVGVVKTEEQWMQLQISFIGAHQYFTKTSQKSRNKKKLKHLRQLKIQAGLNAANT